MVSQVWLWSTPLCHLKDPLLGLGPPTVGTKGSPRTTQLEGFKLCSTARGPHRGPRGSYVPRSACAVCPYWLNLFCFQVKFGLNKGFKSFFKWMTIYLTLSFAERKTGLERVRIEMRVEGWICPAGCLKALGAGPPHRPTPGLPVTLPSVGTAPPGTRTWPSVGIAPPAVVPYGTYLRSIFALRYSPFRFSLSENFGDHPHPQDSSKLR